MLESPTGPQTYLYEVPWIHLLQRNLQVHDDVAAPRDVPVLLARVTSEHEPEVPKKARVKDIGQFRKEFWSKVALLKRATQGSSNASEPDSCLTGGLSAWLCCSATLTLRHKLWALQFSASRLVFTSLRTSSMRKKTLTSLGVLSLMDQQTVEVLTQDYMRGAT